MVIVLTHARECSPGEPLHAIAPAHCTGWRAVNALAAAFGDAVVPSAVGKTYRF